MANSDDSGNRPNATAPSEAGAGPRRRMLRILVRGGLLVGLFIGAALASWRIRAFTADRNDAEVPHGAAKNAPKKMHASRENAAEMLARGDRALDKHRFAEALAQYEQVLAGAPTSAALVDYRVGLCHEILGQTDKAIADYRQAITVSPSPPLSFACHLAMARCLVSTNSFIEARQVLYPIVLNESKQREMPDAFFAEARCLIALALARETYPVTIDRLALDRLASATEVAVDVPFYLEETAGSLAAVKDDSTAVHLAPLMVQPRNGDKPALALHVQQRGKPAQELLDKLAAEAGWSADWTPTAQSKVDGRMIDLDVRDWPLLELLELTADSLDLTCRLDGATLRWSTRTELEPLTAAAVKREMAQRALESAIGIDPSHPLAHAAMLELANGLVAASKVSEALAWYDRLIRDEASTPCVALAYYNRAQLYVRKQASLQARREYYRTIDQAPGHDIALRALMRLGQLALEDDAREAIALFRRVQSSAPASVYQPLAALNLAAALLSIEQPEQAKIVLQQRAVLHQPPFRNSAAFLDAYASYLLAKATKQSRREATDLLSVMGQSQETILLGPLGQSLRARAYDDLVFPEETERMLRQALATVNVKTKLAAHLELKLGDVLLKQDQRDKAQPFFEKVAATNFSDRSWARFQLARLDLQDKRWKQCAERCQQLWEEKSFADRAALLQMWGFAYEGMRDFDRAAQCFAGTAPN